MSLMNFNSFNNFYNYEILVNRVQDFDTEKTQIE